MKVIKKTIVLMFLIFLLVPFSYGQGNGLDISDKGNVTVKFETGENTVPVDEINIKAGSKILNDIYTERYGYSFEGWLRDGKKFDIKNTPVNESITLFPKWALKKQNYSVDPLLYRDDRFEEGYPKFFEENGKLYIDIKLKEYVNGASVSMIYKDKMREADVECVLHGHFGINDLELDDADHYEKINIEGGQEKRIELDKSRRNYGRLAIGAFVISTSDKISEKPTIIVKAYKHYYNDSKNDSSFRAYSGYIAEDGKKILIECSNEIDKTSKLLSSDFKLTLNGQSVAINSVEVLSSPYNIGFKVDSLGTLTEKRNNNEMGELENELKNLKIEYVGNTLKDVENNCANKNSFEDVWFTVYERPVMSKQILSPEKDRMVFIIKGTILDYIDGKIFYNGEKIFFDNMDSKWGENTFSVIYDFNNPLTIKQIEQSNYVVDYISESYDFLDPEFKQIANADNFSLDTCMEVVIKEANYEIQNKQLEVLLNNHLDMSNDYLDVLACSFVLNVDGQEVILKGVANSIYTYEGITEIDFYVDCDLNISQKNKVTLKYEALHLNEESKKDDNFHLKNQVFQIVNKLDEVDVNLY